MCIILANLTRTTAMHRVRLPRTESSWAEIEEMKDWCRYNIGPGRDPKTNQVNWQTRIGYRYFMGFLNSQPIAFYFKEPKHATLFTLRWYY